MGEAKKKKQQQQQDESRFLSQFQGTDAIVAQVALRLYQRFVLPTRFVGGCYHLTFFLEAHLRRRHSIKSEAVVGFVNDGDGPITSSHAWLETEGKPTDLALSLTHDAAVPTGSVLIAGREFKSGVAQYTYHRQRDAEALRALIELEKMDGRYSAAIAAKEQEHALMCARSQSAELIDEYLLGAPAGTTYDDLARIVETK